MTVRVSVDRRDGIHHWTLDRPAARNALDSSSIDELLSAATRAEADAECRAVVLDGAPPVFCAGSDVRELSRLPNEAILRHEGRWPALRAAMRNLDVPVVAKIQGGAFGGGLFLALYADLRVASDDAMFAAPEVELGWLPPGGLEELIDAVGSGRARELVLTASPIAASHALSIGLINMVTSPDALDDGADAVARRLARLPAAAVASVKRYFRARAGSTLAELDEVQLSEFASNLATSTASASIARFRPRGKTGSTGGTQ